MSLENQTNNEKEKDTEKPKKKRKLVDGKELKIEIVKPVGDKPKGKPGRKKSILSPNTLKAKANGKSGKKGSEKSQSPLSKSDIKTPSGKS